MKPTFVVVIMAQALSLLNFLFGGRVRRAIERGSHMHTCMHGHRGQPGRLRALPRLHCACALWEYPPPPRRVDRRRRRPAKRIGFDGILTDAPTGSRGALISLSRHLSRFPCSTMSCTPGTQALEILCLALVLLLSSPVWFLRWSIRGSFQAAILPIPASFGCPWHQNTASPCTCTLCLRSRHRGTSEHHRYKDRLIVELHSGE